MADSAQTMRMRIWPCLLLDLAISGKSCLLSSWEEHSLKDSPLAIMLFESLSIDSLKNAAQCLR